MNDVSLDEIAHIAMVTAHTRDSTAGHCFKLHATKYLTKIRNVRTPVTHTITNRLWAVCGRADRCDVCLFIVGRSSHVVPPVEGARARVDRKYKGNAIETGSRMHSSAILMIIKFLTCNSSVASRWAKLNKGGESASPNIAMMRPL